MDNKMQVFNDPEFGQVRIVTIDGEPWFVGKDVAVALGYEKPTDTVRKHVDEEDRGISKMETPSGKQQMAIINESGLYALIFGSKLESAKRFKHWVTAEVLPSIRKTGSYGQHRPKLDELHLRAMELIVECGTEKLPYMGIILQDLGDPVLFESARPPEIKKSGMNHPGIPANVVDFIGITEISGRPTHDVYQEYVSYCEGSNEEPVPHVSFSKMVNALLGTQVIQKRFGKVNKRIFIKP